MESTHILSHNHCSKVGYYVEKSRLNRYEHNFLIWTASLSTSIFQLTESPPERSAGILFISHPVVAVAVDPDGLPIAGNLYCPAF